MSAANEFSAISLQKANMICLCEGSAEKATIEALLSSLGKISGSCAIVDTKGLNKGIINSALGSISLAGKSVLIFCDAEQNKAQSKIDQLSSMMQKCFGKSINIKSHQKYGLCDLGEVPLFVFISPDNSNSGRIEDIFLQKLDVGNSKECIDNLEKCSHEHNLVFDSKSRIYTYGFLSGKGMRSTAAYISAGFIVPETEWFPHITAAISDYC